MRRLAIAALAVAVYFLVAAAQPAAAQSKGCLSGLFHHGCKSCCTSCSPDCQVYIHCCKCESGSKNGGTAPPPPPAAQRSQQQVVYAQITPSMPAYGMPMMAAMPMAPQVYVAQPSQLTAQQPPAPPQTPGAGVTGCGACEPRIKRLEKGVKTLNKRLDELDKQIERIALTLENHNRAIEHLHQ